MLIPDEIKGTISGLLESAIAGTESAIRTRDYHGLRGFVTAEEEWLARYKAALAWLSAQEQSVTAEPVADWDDAPEWANYWAVNPTGRAYWYELRPYRGEHVWHKVKGSKSEEAERAVASWRTTLQQRRPGGA